MDNIRQVTESLKDLIGTGQGQVNTAGDKIKRDLDQLSVTLEKLNRSIDEINDVASKVNRGEGTVGKLLTDDTIARNVGDISEDAAGFVRSLTRLQTIVGISEEMHCPFGSCGSGTLSWKTYLSLKLQPRPDKYYEIELIDDPRGYHSYNHQTQVTTTGTGTGTSMPSTLNIDTYNRTSAFRFSFLFAKRIEGRGVGLTARLGIKESTGGGGAIVDFWGQRLALSLDLFDFVSEQYPRIKVMGALEMFKHVWLLGGVDDVLNSATNASGPVDASNRAIASCGPATPAGYCQGGRDWFVGARLSFNDEDLRSLLTVGGAALSGLGGGAR
jgi:phospholipid/cholesterol/gamma-HCH transport system substrate-binding protein